jgi:hypothetical protein
MSGLLPNLTMHADCPDASQDDEPAVKIVDWICSFELVEDSECGIGS